MWPPDLLEENILSLDAKSFDLVLPADLWLSEVGSWFLPNIARTQPVELSRQIVRLLCHVWKNHDPQRQINIFLDVFLLVTSLKVICLVHVAV